MHAAETYPGAQFYMECAQLNIQGGSGAKSPSTVAFPGAYKGSDPGASPANSFLSIWCGADPGVSALGITINIYEPLSSYTIPGESAIRLPQLAPGLTCRELLGPPVFTC